MTLKRYANFEEKLTSGLKKDLRIFTRALESVKNWGFDEILLSKVEKA